MFIKKVVPTPFFVLVYNMPFKDGDLPYSWEHEAGSSLTSPGLKAWSRHAYSSILP